MISGTSIIRKRMKEQELASMCRNGDRAAFAALFKEYAPLLMAVCRRYTGQEEDAKEVIQEGFKKIIELFDDFEFRGEGSLRAWMSKIMMNCSLAYMKKKRREEFRKEPLYEHSLEEWKEEDVDTKGIPDEVIMDFIEKLPTGCRIVLNMYVFEKLDHETIASILNISKSASTARLYRARRLLEEMIKDYIKLAE